MEPETLLIVEQQNHPPEELPELLKTLGRDYGLDSYICRQRLLGQGQALLASGSAEAMEAIRDTLAPYAISAWGLPGETPRFSPFQLTRLEVAQDQLSLFGREKELVIPRDATLLILLADLSGQLIERNLSQILSSQRYRGTAGAGLAEEKWQRTILQGRPVLDIYLLDNTGVPQGAVRALPGKFDHRGLGERATLSSGRNLLQLLELAREYAGQCRVDMRFGLSPLPNATLQPAKPNDLDALKKNLRNLTRYAWLQAALDRQRRYESERPQTELSAATSAVLAAASPELAVAGSLREELASGFARAATDQERERRHEDPPLQEIETLPPPPEVQRHNIWTDPKTLGGIALAVLFALLTHFGQSARWLAPLLQKAVVSGGITALLALGLLYFAFRRLVLKRQIENTPTSKIRSVAMGMVEIKGTARRQYALVSPMSNIACVFYRLTRYKRNNKNNWVVSSITSSGQVPFWVEDDTGRISVDPSGASVKPAHRQESFDQGSIAFGGFSSSDEKWVEELIYDGALVYVLGEAQPKIQRGASKNERRVAALRQLKQDRQRLAEFDSNGDGRIDADEWQTARDAVDEQLLHEDLTASEQRRLQEDLVVISRPRQRALPFIVAETASETHLAGGYGWSVGLTLTGGITCAILTTWFILT